MLVPEDECVLELTLPDGATVTVDGRDYGNKPEFTFRNLARTKTYVSNVVIRSSRGETEQHKLLLVSSLNLCPDFFHIRIIRRQRVRAYPGLLLGFGTATRQVEK